MAKLYFSYSAMNAGKSTILLQASHNYQERGMKTLLLTAALDGRHGKGRIGSRIGLGADAIVGVRLATSVIIGGAAEIVAYGTAVKFK